MLEAHRATDSEEKARIRHKGGRVVQGRVMGVLEPSRVIGVRASRVFFCGTVDLTSVAPETGRSEGAERKGRGGERTYSFVACLCQLTIDHASLSRPTTVPTPNRYPQHMGAHYIFSAYGGENRVGMLEECSVADFGTGAFECVGPVLQ